MNSKVMGCGPKILVIPFDVVLSDEVMQMSRNLGVDILHSKKVSGGIILSWIPVSATQIPKSSWVIFENFITQ